MAGNFQNRVAFLDRLVVKGLTVPVACNHGSNIFCPSETSFSWFQGLFLLNNHICIGVIAPLGFMTCAPFIPLKITTGTVFHMVIIGCVQAESRGATTAARSGFFTSLDDAAVHLGRYSENSEGRAAMQSSQRSSSPPLQQQVEILVIPWSFLGMNTESSLTITGSPFGPIIDWTQIFVSFSSLLYANHRFFPTQTG